MQTMEDGVRSTVTSIDEELMATSTAGQHPGGTRGHPRGQKLFGRGSNIERRERENSLFEEEGTSNHASCSRQGSEICYQARKEGCL
jgi:hypothetical protein